MTIRYRRELVELMNHLNLPLIGAEIGVAEGNFSKDLLTYGLDKLYSVDAWQKLDQTGDGGFEQEWHDENYRQTVEKLKPFGKKSVIVRGLSFGVADKVADNSLGLLYLDGDHSENGVTSDLNAWFDKVVDGGIIAGHDYLNASYGVNKAVHEFCAGRFEVFTIPEDKDVDAGFYFIKK